MKKEEENIFDMTFGGVTEKDYDKLRQRGASEEEIELLKGVFALSDTVKMMPKNMSKFFDKINTYFPDEPQAALEKMLKLPETDPDFFVEMMAVQQVLDEITPSTNSKKIEKVSVNEASAELQKVENEELRESFLSLVQQIKNLSPEEKEILKNQMNKK